MRLYPSSAVLSAAPVGTSTTSLRLYPSSAVLSAAPVGTSTTSLRLYPSSAVLSAAPVGTSTTSLRFYPSSAVLSAAPVGTSTTSLRFYRPWIFFKPLPHIAVGYWFPFFFIFRCMIDYSGHLWFSIFCLVSRPPVMRRLDSRTELKWFKLSQMNTKES